MDQGSEYGGLTLDSQDSAAGPLIAGDDNVIVATG
jgi:hypothetical protein